MSVFFNSRPYNSSKDVNMTIGEMHNKFKSGDIQIPDYQREYVWKYKQQQSYLESLSRMAPIFGPIINKNENDGVLYIMDGQNRLTTIIKFLQDEITFTDENGKKIKYSELNSVDKRKINNITISYTETQNWSELDCQDFFRNIQEGEKLTKGELIHSERNNPFTNSCEEIYEKFIDLLTKKANLHGMNITNKRYVHLEFIGTLLHMIRTNKFPVRPGPTAYSEMQVYQENTSPLQIDELKLSCDTLCLLLSSYNEIIKNVPRLKSEKTSLKPADHLRLLYFIFKDELYKKSLNDAEYLKIEILLNKVMNKSDPVFNEIVSWGTTQAQKIYLKYREIYYQ